MESAMPCKAQKDSERDVDEFYDNRLGDIVPKHRREVGRHCAETHEKTHSTKEDETNTDRFCSHKLMLTNLQDAVPTLAAKTNAKSIFILQTVCTIV